MQYQLGQSSISLVSLSIRMCKAGMRGRVSGFLAVSLSLWPSLSLSLPFTQMADRYDAPTVEGVPVTIFAATVGRLCSKGIFSFGTPMWTDRNLHTQLVCQMLMALGCLVNRRCARSHTEVVWLTHWSDLSRDPISLPSSL